MKTAKAVRTFVQATSVAEHMPATTTGDIMLFHHGQRSARKSTPTVNGVYPSSWTEDTVMSFDGTQHWDGVNLLKHHPEMVILPGSKEALNKCRLDVEGHYSLLGVDILVSDWPRGDGCHKPDSAVMDENSKVVALAAGRLVLVIVLCCSRVEHVAVTPEQVLHAATPQTKRRRATSRSSEGLGMQGSSARDSRRQLSDCKHTALHVTGAHLRTYRPAPAFISEFWRLAVDP